MKKEWHGITACRGCDYLKMSHDPDVDHLEPGMLNRAKCLDKREMGKERCEHFDDLESTRALFIADKELIVDDYVLEMAIKSGSVVTN